MVLWCFKKDALDGLGEVSIGGMERLEAKLGRMIE